MSLIDYTHLSQPINWGTPDYGRTFNSDPVLTDMLADYMDKLATHGDAESLALMFEEAGIQAVPGQSDSCAVTRHAEATLDLPENVEVRVGGASMMLHRFTDKEIDLGRAGTTTVRDVEVVACVDHEPVVQKFISEFDGRRYPALLDPEWMAHHQKQMDTMAMAIANHPVVPTAPTPMAKDFYDKQSLLNAGFDGATLTSMVMDEVAAVDWSHYPQKYILGPDADPSLALCPAVS